MTISTPKSNVFLQWVAEKTQEAGSCGEDIKTHYIRSSAVHSHHPSLTLCSLNLLNIILWTEAEHCKQTSASHFSAGVMLITPRS